MWCQLAAVMVKLSHVPTELRLATSARAPPASAHTYLPLAEAFRPNVPAPLSTRVNFSQPPALLRLAISGQAPAASAVTYLLLTSACRLIVPSEFWVTLNFSQAPAVVRLAISHQLPAFSAVTYLPLAAALRLIDAGSRNTAFDAALAAESPWVTRFAECATTVKVYEVRVLRPMTVQFVVASSIVLQTWPPELVTV